MTKLALNKSSLQSQRKKLGNYRRFLPSLELKRQQLRAERTRAITELARVEAAHSMLLDTVGEDLPMLANREIDLTGLAQVVAFEQDRENIVGVWLPRLVAFEVRIKDYSRLGRPHWVDVVAARLRDSVELDLRLRFARQRVEILDRAVRRITQRVNLFDKVLIPRAERDIHRIRVYLGDAERAAVVRSKVAQRKRRSA